MLSGETSIGTYPIQTVETMNDILKKAEANFPFHKNINYLIPDSFQDKLFDSVNRAVVEISKRINAQAIVVFTELGRTAKIISKYKPNCKIIALSNKFETMNMLSLYWGVIPIFSQTIDKEKIFIEEAKRKILELDLVKKGELLLFTAGSPQSEHSRVNWLNFEII
jgi:pyruvate kinase